MSEESRKIGQMTFDYADKEPAINSVVGMSTRMQIMDDSNMPQILRSKYVADVHDPEKIKEV